MIVLGIETSCDETSAAVVQDGRVILSQKTATSADVHKLYGGVFPEMACRRHIDAILPVVASALQEASLSFGGKHDQFAIELDAIAVARGPGLIGALLIGLQVAKGLSLAWNKPLVGVNHIEAHLYASMMEKTPPFPALGFVLSGGHTLMLLIRELGRYELIGATVDDAIGEAFDKTATLLGLSYPGGPALEQMALRGDPTKIAFSYPRVKNNPLAFSFSGLKTAALYAAKEAKIEEYPHIAASFQKTAFEDLIRKARKAMEIHSCRSLVFGGGVCSNRTLRKLFSEAFAALPQFWPAPGLSTDNAAMIAGLGCHRFQAFGGDPLDLEALPRTAFWNLKASGETP